MKNILIGTCVPGQKAKEIIEHLIAYEFESIAINFHMDFMGVELEELAISIGEILKSKNITISALGFYCNPLTDKTHEKGLQKVIDCAHLFDASIVSTFAGAIPGRPINEAIPVFGKVFGELARRAADRNVRIAIENCPMDGNWQKATCNIAINPKAWEMMFNAVPNHEQIGLEWEPAHQMCQLIDPVAQLRKWTQKIFHIHGKDANIYHDVLEADGIYSDFCDARTPGFGDCDWRKFFTILYKKGYEGNIDIEGYHDPIYNRKFELTGQLYALRYLKMCRGGEITPSPWKQDNK